MPAFKTIGKGVTKAQYEAFEKAREKAGLSTNQGIDEALRLFCESQAVDWPKTGKHGGDRKSTRHE